MKISQLSLALLCSILLLATAHAFPSFGNQPSPSPTNDVIPHPDLSTLLRDLEEWGFYIVEIIKTTREATIFIPIGSVHENESLSPSLLSMLDPSKVFYHVIPYAYSSYQLKVFSNGTRFPTLVPNKSILVTSNYNGSNFTIDGIPITRPDLFYNGIIAVHGLPSPLDYKVYGGNAQVPLPPFPSPPSFHPPAPSPQPSPSCSSSPLPPAQALTLMPASPKLAPAAPQPSQRSADSSNAEMLASKFVTTILAICSMVMGFQILI